MTRRAKKKTASGAGLRICFDRVLTGRQLLKAQKLAEAENRENAPFGMYAALTAPPEAFLTPKDIASDIPNERLALAALTGKKWANGRVLTVGFVGGTRAQQNHVQDVAPQWSQFCNITFKFVASGAADLRVAFNPNSGAWSYIGADNLGIARNQPTMNLGWIDEGTTIHEFGHALGMIHEHQHPRAEIPWNKPAVYRSYAGPPNHWSKAMVDNNVFGRYATSVTQFSAYDRKSIMHYPIEARHLTDPSYAVGWNKALSETDKSFIGDVYPKAAPPPVTAGAISVNLETKTVLLPAGWTARQA